MGVGPTRLRVARLVPAVLVATFLLDVALRLLITPDRLAIRAWEAAIRVSPSADSNSDPGLRGYFMRALLALGHDPLLGTFRTNFSYANDRAHGDLPNIGNLPQYRVFHRETFHTDDHGYRNLTARHGAAPPDVLLIGSSFIVGSGVSDDETLGAQLARASGRSVYNAAGLRVDFMADLAGHIRRTARRHGMTRGLVIVDHLPGENSELLKKLPRGGPLGPDRRPRPEAPLARSVANFLTFAPLEVLARRTFRRLQNDHILPNVPARQIIVGRLGDGSTMLFRRDEMDAPPETGSELEEDVAFYRRLAEILRADGLDMMVQLLPRSIVIYSDLLDPARPVDPRVEAMARLARELEAAGIPAVDPVPALRAAAAEALQRGDVLYLRDDTHWNARGIAVTVEAILRRCPSAGWPACPPPTAAPAGGPSVDWRGGPTRPPASLTRPASGPPRSP